MRSFENFVELIESNSETEWQQCIYKLAKEYGFEQSLIAISPIRPTSLDQAFLCSNYQPKWLQTYGSKQLVKIDPTVAHCITKSTPLIWEPEIFSSKPQMEMYEEASGHGLRSGISLPYHGARGEVGILCFVNNDKPCKGFKRDTMHNLLELAMLRDFAFEGSLKFAQFNKRDGVPILTPRETECLQWCADGKTTWETAQIMRCSESNVNFHWGNLRDKLKANSRRQAIAKAFRFGLLQSH
jgi:LuxR family quorum-sensing transcriptional regulator LasR